MFAIPSTTVIYVHAYILHDFSKRKLQRELFEPLLCPSTIPRRRERKEKKKKRKKEIGNGARGEWIHSTPSIFWLPCQRGGVAHSACSSARDAIHSGSRWTLPNGADLSNGARRRAETVRVTVRLDLWPLRFCCGMKKGRNSSLQKGNYQAVATVLDHPPSLDYTSSDRISCLVYRILSTEFLSFIFIDSFKIFVRVQSNIVNSWSIRFINTGGNISPS